MWISRRNQGAANTYLTFKMQSVLAFSLTPQSKKKGKKRCPCLCFTTMHYCTFRMYLILLMHIPENWCFFVFFLSLLRNRLKQRWGLPNLPILCCQFLILLAIMGYVGVASLPDLEFGVVRKMAFSTARLTIIHCPIFEKQHFWQLKCNQ